MDKELESLISLAEEEQVLPGPRRTRLRWYAAGACTLLAGTVAAALFTQKTSTQSLAVSEVVELQAVKSECSEAGKGCLESRCCKDSSLTCYKKNDEWADCKASCKAGEVDPNSPSDQQSPWSCEVLTRGHCSEAGGGCLVSRCCKDPNLKCYEKNDEWADCKASCKAGEVDPNSPSDQQSPWTCNILDGSDGGDDSDCTCKTNGKPGKLGICKGGQPGCCNKDNGENCDNATPIDPDHNTGKACKCSADPPSDGAWAKGDEGVIAVCRDGGSDGQQHCCEKKHYTECGPADVDPDVPGECSEAGKGCLESRCCKDSSLTCYKKNDHWADCKASCKAGEVDPNSPSDQQSPWSCEVLSRSECSEAGKGCLESKCCKDPSLKCYEKNDDWADCKAWCNAGEVDWNSPEADRAPWTCNVLSPDK